MTIFIDDKLLYVIGLLSSTVLSRLGMMSIINPHIMQVFEFRNYLMIGGFARFFNQLSCFFAALTSVLLSFKYKTSDELFFPYRIISSVCIGLSSMGLILSFFEKNEKFKFIKKEELQDDSLYIQKIYISEKV